MTGESQKGSKRSKRSKGCQAERPCFLIWPRCHQSRSQARLTWPSITAANVSAAIHHGSAAHDIPPRPPLSAHLLDRNLRSSGICPSIAHFYSTQLTPCPVLFIVFASFPLQVNRPPARTQNDNMVNQSATHGHQCSRPLCQMGKA